MYWNKEIGKIQTNKQCMTCRNFDKLQKKCKGLGITCFEYDATTKTCVDPITKMPIKL